MRYISSIIVFLLFSSNVISAQEGEIAPNFTITDIDGESHELYAYLEEGKTVVLEFFALWCPPCVTRFNEKVGDDVHIERGPASIPNDIVYISVENDPNTSAEETLFGIIDFESVQHPVVILEGDDFDQFSIYNGSGWPDVFSICPNKIINRLDNTSPKDSVIMRSIYPRVDIADDSLLINCSMPSIEATISNMEYNTVSFSWIEVLPSGAVTSPPFDNKALNPLPTAEGVFRLAASNYLNQCGTADTVVVTKIDQRKPMLLTDELELVIPCDNLQDTLNIYTEGLFGGGVWTRSWSTTDGNIVKIFDTLQQHHILVQGEGTYLTSTIDDINGCETQLEITVTHAPGIDFIVSEVQNSRLNNNNGSISVTPEGGTAPFEYLWSTGDTSSSIQNLFPGTYSVTVTDYYGCVFESDVVVSSTTATEDIESGIVVQAAPNPSKDFLNITLQRPANKVFLLNKHGQKVKELNLLSLGKHSIDISDLPSGMYVLMTILQSGKVNTQKIMIIN